jgi:hypothetical protein
MRHLEQGIGVQIVLGVISMVRLSLQLVARWKNVGAGCTLRSVQPTPLCGVQPTTKTDNMSIYTSSRDLEKNHKGAVECITISRALTCKSFKAQHQGYVFHFKRRCGGKTWLQDKKFHANETQLKCAYCELSRMVSTKMPAAG